MRRKGVLALIMCQLSTPCALAEDGVQSKNPYAILRHTQDAMEESAFGKPATAGELNGGSSKFVAALGAAPAAWDNRRTRNAIAIFLLTGGDPSAVRNVLPSKRGQHDETPLVEHSLIYSDGGAMQQLTGFIALDPRTVSPEVGGALALAQARALTKFDSGAAKLKLLEARVLSPGGLVEEASLRQELFLQDDAPDAVHIAKIAARYFNRFSKSWYSANFGARFQKVMSDTWREPSPLKRREVLGALSELPQSHRIKLGIRLAVTSLMQGDLNAARDAIGVVCHASKGGAERVSRCDFYDALLSQFEKVEPSKLNEMASSDQLNTEDRLLLQSALAMLSPPAESEGHLHRVAIGLKEEGAATSEVALRVREQLRVANSIVSEAR